MQATRVLDHTGNHITHSDQGKTHASFGGRFPDSHNRTQLSAPNIMVELLGGTIAYYDGIPKIIGQRSANAQEQQEQEDNIDDNRIHETQETSTATAPNAAALPLGGAIETLDNIVPQALQNNLHHAQNTRHTFYVQDCSIIAQKEYHIPMEVTGQVPIIADKRAVSNSNFDHLKYGPNYDHQVDLIGMIPNQEQHLDSVLAPNVANHPLGSATNQS